ncbi:GlxA family transcriptional regulator [Oricola sp.]|uniref:GlxA family transcriptional regulator n=1 Tax=Oricola sp. TaxID=1979950 RepID=UPI003BAA81D2
MSYSELGVTPLECSFLVLPGSSLLTLASAVDPLRAANRMVGSRVFDWAYVSLDGEAVPTSAEIAWPVRGRFDPARRIDVFGVIAGFGAPGMRDRLLLGGIFKAARQARLTVGIESGAWLLARAGLLDGLRATTHWHDFEDFAAAFPAVDLRTDRAVTDGKLLTTSGASPTFDAMIDLVRRTCGETVAIDTAGNFIHDAHRAAGEAQVPFAFGPPGARDVRFIDAVRAMESRIDEPVTIEAIARRVSLSVRGFENLFLREIGKTPGAFFLSLRLNAARRLLADTQVPINEIAARTGFSSSAAFSRAFKRGFAKSPTDFRRDYSAA